MIEFQSSGRLTLKSSFPPSRHWKREQKATSSKSCNALQILPVQDAHDTFHHGAQKPSIAPPTLWVFFWQACPPLFHHTIVVALFVFRCVSPIFRGLRSVMCLCALHIHIVYLPLLSESSGKLLSKLATFLLPQPKIKKVAFGTKWCLADVVRISRP